MRTEKDTPQGLLIPHTATYAEAEQLLVQSRIDHFRGNKTHAAKSLGIALKTIYNILGRRPTRILQSVKILPGDELRE